MRVVADVNKYVSDHEPWKLKAEDERERLGTILHVTAQCVHDLNLVLAPFLPFSANGSTWRWAARARWRRCPGSRRPRTSTAGTGYPVITGDYSGAPTWQRHPVVVGTPSPSRPRSSPSSTPTVVDEELARLESPDGSAVRVSSTGSVSGRGLPQVCVRASGCRWWRAVSGVWRQHRCSSSGVTHGSLSSTRCARSGRRGMRPRCGCSSGWWSSAPPTRFRPRRRRRWSSSAGTPVWPWLGRGAVGLGVRGDRARHRARDDASMPADGWSGQVAGGAVPAAPDLEARHRR